MSKWILESLGNLISYISKGIAPKYVENFGEQTIWVLNQKCNRNGVISFKEARLHDLSQKSVSSERMLREKDILINSTGTGTAGRVAQIETLQTPATVDGHMIILRANSRVDPLYLGYALKQQQKTIEELAEGSTGQTEINRERLCNEILIYHPQSIEEQQKISNVLYVLDKKISLNNRINDNLQQQADALFESWFVNYEPWDGVRPTTWKDEPLGLFVEIKRGGSPRPIQAYLADSGFHWLKISDVTSLNSPFVFKIKEHIRKEGLKKTVFLHSGELVLSNSATPGIPKILGVDTCIHDGWLYFPKSEFSKYYLYLFFKHIKKELITLGNGSVFTNLKINILKNFVITRADNITLKKFDALVSPLFDEMINVDKENVQLTAMRKILLPKLIWGKINRSNTNL